MFLWVLNTPLMYVIYRHINFVCAVMHTFIIIVIIHESKIFNSAALFNSCLVLNDSSEIERENGLKVINSYYEAYGF